MNTGSKKMKVKQAALGERAALSGYGYQTCFQVQLVIQRLLGDSLFESAEFSNLNAGKWDDLILHSKRQIDCFQFKQRGNKTVTFSLLCGKNGLLGELAESWKFFRNGLGANKNKKLFFHLVTNIKLSSSKRAKIPYDKAYLPANINFKTFYEEAILKYKKAIESQKNSPEKSVPKEWKKAFDEWRKASGLTLQEFRKFQMQFSIISCSLPDPFKSADRQDVDFLYHHFQTVVGNALRNQESIIISAKELRELLGKSRFYLRNIHAFSLPPEYYPIQKTKTSLLQKFLTYNSGYIALLGTPGSGKTTLLTDVTKSLDNDYRIITYYAYHPSDQKPIIAPRGYLDNFLNDITKLIDEAFGETPLPPKDDKNSLREKLNKQIAKIHDDYIKNKKKTVLIIDGLDHIERPDSPQIGESFLGELPVPDSIPDGLLIILGSQHLNLSHLNRSIETSINSDSSARKVVMDALNESETKEILSQAGLKDWLSSRNNDYLKRIFILTEGHPLATGYFIQWVVDKNNWQNSNPEDLIQELEKKPYIIKPDYSSLWSDIEKKCTGIKNFVGLISRLEGDIDFEWVETWKDCQQELIDFQDNFKHLFKKSSKGHWRFFHSSFRLFLIEKSVEGILGTSKTREIEFHKTLAEKCLQATKKYSYRWNVIYHWAECGQVQEVFKKANADFFLEQYLCFRPLYEITRDIHYCLKIATNDKNANLILQYLVLYNRFSQAGITWDLSNFEDNFNQILNKINEQDKARYRISLLYESLSRPTKYSQLQDVENALGQIETLLSLGENLKARELFKIFDVIDIITDDFLMLAERNDYAENTKTEFLVCWAYTASRFYHLDKVLNYLKKLSWKASNINSRKLSAIKQNIYFHVLSELCERFAFCGRFDEFEKTLTELEQESEELKEQRVSFWWIDKCLVAIRACRENNEKREQYVKILTKRLSLNSIKNFFIKTQNKKTAKHGRKKAIKQVLELVSLISEYNTNLAIKHANLVPFDDFVELVRESFEKDVSMKIEENIALVEPYMLSLVLQNKWREDSLQKLIPHFKSNKGYPDDDRWYCISKLITVRCMLSEIRGWRILKQKKNISPNSYLLEKYSEFILTYVLQQTLRRNWQYAYINNAGVQKRNYLKLISEIAKIDDEALIFLVKLIDDVWNNQNSNTPHEVKTAVLAKLGDYPIDQKWLKDETDKLINEKIEVRDGNIGVIELLLRQAEIAVKVNCFEKTREFLKRALLVAFSVRQEKDYQLSSLMEWFPKQIKQEKSVALIQEQIEETVQQIYLNELSGSGTVEAATQLFIGIANCNIPVAMDILVYFIQEKLDCGYTDDVLANFIDYKMREHLSLTREPLAEHEVALFTSILIILCLPVRHDGPSNQVLRVARSLLLVAPISGDMSNVIIANKLIGACCRLFPNSEGRKKFIHAIVTSLPLPQRASINLNASDMPTKDDPALKEGTEQPYPLQTKKAKYHREEVIDLILQDPLNVKKFIADEVKSSDKYRYRKFDWSSVIDRVEFILSDKENNILLESLIDGKCDPKELLDFILSLEKRNALSNKSKAEQLAASIINSNEETSRGWVRYFDGNHRLKALLVLKRINPAKWRERIFGEFLKALDGRMYYSGLIDASYDLYQLFSESYKLREATSIIREDRKLIYSGMVDEMPCALDISYDKKKQSLFECGISLIVNQLSLPINYLSQQSLSELVWLARYSNKTYKVIGIMLKNEKNLLLLERLLLFLEKTINICQKHKNLILEGVKKCCEMEHYAIVASARKILSALNEDPPLLPKKAKPPLIIIPPEKKILLSTSKKDLDIYQKEQYNINPFFSYEIALIAGVLNVSKEEVCERIGAVMNKSENEYLSKPYNWVRSSFIRSSVFKTRDAINKYLHYIQSDNWGKYELPYWADNVFRGHDEATSFHLPQRIPEWIKTANIWPEHSYSQEHAKTWVDSFDLKYINDKSTLKVSDEWIVVYEKSEFVFGGDFYNVEKRCINLLIGSLPTKFLTGQNFEDDICVKAFNTIYSDYIKGNVPNCEGNSLIICIDNYKFLNACPSWSGIHPEIAFSLGLQCDETFPPKWIDKNNQLRCYTINWKEGVWTHQHYSRGDICSKGWVVLMHKNTLANIVDNVKDKNQFDTVLNHEIQFTRETYDYRLSQFNSIHNRSRKVCKKLSLSLG